MLFILKIAKNRKSIFEKRHHDVTFVCQSPQSFSKTSVNEFYSNSNDYREKILSIISFKKKLTREKKLFSLYKTGLNTITIPKRVSSICFCIS